MIGVNRAQGRNEYPMGKCTAMVLTPTGRLNADDIDEALAAYALALDPEDVPSGSLGFLSRHLAECERCRNWLEIYAEVAADLGLSAQPRRPPAHLLRHIASAARLADLTHDDSLIVDVTEHTRASTVRSAAKRPAT